MAQKVGKPDIIDVALYGGAFDPPHPGHEAVVKALHKDNPERLIWIVPSGIREDKQYSVSEKERLRAIDLFIRKLKSADGLKNKLFLSKIEIKTESSVKFSKYKNISGTYELVNALEEIYNSRVIKYRFYFVIGSDLLRDLEKWKNLERLKEMVQFILLKREGYDYAYYLEDLISKGFKIMTISHDQLPIISSTDLRK